MNVAYKNSSLSTDVKSFCVAMAYPLIMVSTCSTGRSGD